MKAYVTFCQLLFHTYHWSHKRNTVTKQIKPQLYIAIPVIVFSFSKLTSSSCFSRACTRDWLTVTFNLESIVTLLEAYNGAINLKLQFKSIIYTLIVVYLPQHIIITNTPLKILTLFLSHFLIKIRNSLPFHPRYFLCSTP